MRYATSVQGRVSEQTHRKSPALVHKQALIKNYCLYDQTTQNYSTANNPNKHYLHFTPFSRLNHNYVNNTPIVLQPSSIAEKDSKHNNRPKKCTYPQVENITILPKYNYSLKNTTSRLLKDNDIVQSVSVTFSTARFDGFLQSIIICAPAITPLPFAP